MNQEIKNQQIGTLDRWSNKIQTVLAFRELLENLVMRDVTARYKQTILGLYWAIVNPLVTALVLTLVFAYFIRVPTGDTPYILFFLVGFLPWTFFANSLTSASTSLTGNANLLNKVPFPREILPTAAVLARGVDFLFSGLVLIVFLIYYHTPLTANLLWLPAIVLLQLAFTLALSLLLSAANLFYRDVGQLLGLILMLWMYLTPVIYPASMVPEQFYRFYMLNPMVPIVESYRRVILEGTDPHWKYLCLSAVIVILLLAASYAIFKRVEPLFAESV